jgi:NitT/TauT family transport system substrate-binding protein
MASLIKRREIVSVMAAAPALSALGSRAARAQDKTGTCVYPVAVPAYEPQFIADTQGYFKDEGFAFKVIQGGSGVKAREIMASRQADFCIADILHVLQLNNHNRPTRALNAVDTRAPGVRFAVRQDLFDQGVSTIQKAAAWKRPDGRKAIFGVSSIGGTSHLWSYYFMERLGLADKVTWVGVGNTDTMLGSLKSKQIDVLSSAQSLIAESEKNGWGKQIYAPSELKTWNEVIGGPVPVNTNFCLLQTIEKEPEKVQAFTNAIWRAAQFVRKSSIDDTLKAIEKYVGSTSPEANKLEIAELKAVQDPVGVITPDSYARGEKVWYSDLTGIKPVKLEDAFEGKFLKVAQAKYPA